MKSELMHRILGDDPVSIEGKGVNAFTGKVEAKIMIASNITPEVNIAFPNEMSRILFLKMVEPPEEIMLDYCLADPKNPKKVLRRSDGTPVLVGSDLKEHLIKEMPHILYKCRESYKKLCPGHRMIVVPSEVYDMQLDLLGDYRGNLYEELINTFEVSDEIDKDGKPVYITTTELTGEFSEYAKENNMGKIDLLVKDFIRQFEERLQTSPTRKRRGNHQFTMYEGVRKKSIRALRKSASEMAEDIEKGK
jgi:hypothetical protein